MREILFKAKRLDNGEWVEGSLIVLDADSGYYFITEPYQSASTLPVRDLIYNHTYLVDANTICQYTGLTDKNGNKIWENDVVNIDSYSFWEPEDCCYGVVRYSNAKAAFCLDSGSKWIPMYECTGSYTTIYENFGSILDNPKLLENE